MAAVPDSAVIRLKPYQFIHVLDNNSNVTSVHWGPLTFTRQDHEKVVFGPEDMIKVPPRHYCIVQNPVVRSANGGIELDSHGSVKVKHGDEEIRFEQPPFVLYPGEKIVGKVSPLQVVGPLQGLLLKCIRDFKDGAVDRNAGDQWLFKGPGTYIPRVEVVVAQIVKAIVVKPNQALKLRATNVTTDADGVQRKAGEEWLYTKTGAYLPGVDEEVVETVNAFILTDRVSLHLRAAQTFKDASGVQRKAGEEWLVTLKEACTYIPGVNEKVVGEEQVIVLTNRQYCVVIDPYDSETKKIRMGQKEIRKGACSFFLHPGEKLESGIQSISILAEDEAVLLRARETFVDDKETHAPGDRWMVYGPRDYIPPVQVEVIEKRKAIPLDTNEGVYVRDIRDGKVDMITGRSYMLKPNEELWEKELPSLVETLLNKERLDSDASSAFRDKTRVVSYRIPHNAAVQIYDYKNKKPRVVLGPERVLLGPEEQFTIIDLSGDKPKRPHVIKSLALLLGPDFMTDIVVVETSDHARLSLKLSYNWRFEVDPANPSKIFQVPDFVGDSCKAIASRVRGAVAQASFDQFHKHSAEIIRQAVFGVGEDGKLRNRFEFSANSLVISNIDIQSVEPVDQRTRDSLQKSVQLAIEITTKSQEAAARHEALRLEQDAKGRLERQKISDEAEAERSRRELLQLQAQSASVESTGQAIAEAKAHAEAAAIEGEASVKQAMLKAKTSSIRSEAEILLLNSKHQLEVERLRLLNSLEVTKAQEMAKIESEKFQRFVATIGPNTIAAISRAGPEMQARLLKGLGLKSIMITDGNSPINLFNTASGLLGGGGSKK